MSFADRMNICNARLYYRPRSRPVATRIAAAALLLISAIADAAEKPLIDLGFALFQDAALSRNGKVACRTCHDPDRAYANSLTRAIGIDGAVGTRNAPSLIGIGDDPSFFWDGRRTRLEDVVLDPLTNPVEMGQTDTAQVIAALRRQPHMLALFRKAFPAAPQLPTLKQVSTALTAFIRSLKTGSSAYDKAKEGVASLPADAALGETLFAGAAGCSECHTVDGPRAAFSDRRYHHSGVAQERAAGRLLVVAREVVDQSLDPDALGKKLLTDDDWSSLGRFAVSHEPADIGAFKTPSLRNVASTAPYMHDGSIANLSEAVDHEIYYRGFSSGHPVNLSHIERQAIVAFLESLTDER
jgi:cytochrome c peroxidase